MSTSKNVFEATDGNFSTDVLGSPQLAVVDFWAEWCGPCKALGPTIESIANEFAGTVKVFKMNVDENPQTPAKFSIRGIPTVIFFKDGKPVSQVVGLQPREALVEMINRQK